jgi:hypothetical protein
MSLLNQVNFQNPVFPFSPPDPFESARMECGRLVHAALISRTFRSMLLADPIKTIETGYYGEKFTFIREEKERIKGIHALSLADFSGQLLKVIGQPEISFSSEMAMVPSPVKQGY